MLDSDGLIDSGGLKVGGAPVASRAARRAVDRLIVAGGTAAVPESKVVRLSVNARLWAFDRLETMCAVIDWADNRPPESAASGQNDDESEEGDEPVAPGPACIGTQIPLSTPTSATRTEP